MSRLLNLTQCPVFKETGDAKVTTDYGKDITDYPTEGKTGDHWGLDIVRSTGDNNSKTATIVAIESGTVYAQRKYVKDGEKSPSEGNCVYILHDDGVTITKYYHLKEGTVPDKIADNVRVEKGEVLGYMGNTGYSFGAHLHFQVEKLDKKPEKITPKLKGKTVDPEPYLTGEVKINPNEGKYGVLMVYDNETDAREVALALKVLGLNPILTEVE